MVLVASVRSISRTTAIWACAGFGAVASLVLMQYSQAMTYDFGLVRCIFGFFSGIIAYQVHSSRRLRGVKLAGTTASLLEVATIAVILAYEIYGDTRTLLFFAPMVFATATVVFAEEGGIVSRLLCSLPFRRLGDWSYSIYMVHAIVLINLVARGVSVGVKALKIPVDASLGTDPGHVLQAIYEQGTLQALTLTAIYVVATLAVSAITYRFIEVPARAAANRWADRIHTRRSKAPKSDRSGSAPIGLEARQA